MTKKNNRDSILFYSLLVLLAAASYARVWTINGVMWDDNAWLISLYTTPDLNGFLNTGFVEMRRIPQGIFLYLLFWLHKNTDLYFPTWHLLNMVTQIGTPLILYATCLRLFNRQRLLAFLIAMSFIAFPIDQTLPHASSINYRLGLLLAIVSFYLTVLAIPNERRMLTFASVVLAAVSYTVLMEATVALELGRFAIIAYMLNHHTNIRGKHLIQATSLKWLPYLILCASFSVYRLLVRSYGSYADIYQPNFWFWMNGQDNINLLAMLLLLQWAIFLGHVKEASLWAYALGSFGFVILFVFFRTTLKSHLLALSSKSNHVNERHVGWHAFYIGLILIVPSLLLFQFLDRPITWGLHSSHGTIGQFGYALILGSLLFLFLKKVAGKGKSCALYCYAAVCFLFAAGVFFNNLNLDLYRASHKQLNEFWTAFVQRFPNLPPEATFLFDVRIDSFYLPQYHGAYELPLNLLYATSLEPDKFRSFRVVMSNEIADALKKIQDLAQLRQTNIIRPTAWGADYIEAEKFIVIYYDKSGLLVNREIVQKFPATPYRIIVDKNFPELPKEGPRYPLRYKAFKKYSASPNPIY